MCGFCLLTWMPTPVHEDVMTLEGKSEQCKDTAAEPALPVLGHHWSTPFELWEFPPHAPQIHFRASGRKKTHSVSWWSINMEWTQIVESLQGYPTIKCDIFLFLWWRYPCTHLHANYFLHIHTSVCSAAPSSEHSFIVFVSPCLRVCTVTGFLLRPAEAESTECRKKCRRFQRQKKK